LGRMAESCRQVRDSMQIGELSSERSALKWQRGCDGKCHRDSPVTEKLIEEVSTMSIRLYRLMRRQIFQKIGQRGRICGN